MKILNTGMFAAVLAVLLAVGVTPDRASADGNEFDTWNKWHEGGRCDGAHRIRHADSTCLHGWWDNTPALGTGYNAGSMYGAQNHCGDHGAVMAHIDMKGQQDEHFHLTDSSKSRGKDRNNDVRDMYCCVNKSDLCWEDQVEPIESGDLAGHVRLIFVHPSNWSVGYADVSTHEGRYSLCGPNSTYKDQIYCQKDPEGDAKIMPASVLASMTREELRARPCGGAGEPACGCGDHICDKYDCMEKLELSPSHIYDTDMLVRNCLASRDHRDFSTPDPQDPERCSLTRTSCIKGDYPRDYERVNATFDGSLDEVENLENCNGELRPYTCSLCRWGASDCRWRFERYGSAHDSCTDLQVGFSESGCMCNFTARCRTSNGEWTDANLDVEADQAYWIKNCNGSLQNGGSC